MTLGPQEVARIAHLARLALTPDEEARYAGSLSNILKLVDQMQAVDTSGIEPMAHPLDATQPLRPDIVSESNHRDAYQHIAPAVQDGLYLVPKVIE